MLFLKDVAPAGTLSLKDVGIGVETRVPAGDGFMIMTGSRVPPAGAALLLEGGDALLLENGDKLLLEAA